jgi:tight adherence protein B
MDTKLLIPIAVAAGVVLLGVAFASNPDEARDKRVKFVAREKESTVKRKASVDPDAERKKKLMGGIKDLEMRERQMRKARLSIAARIDQAGLTLPEQTFYIGSVGLAIVAALVVFAVGQPFYYAFGAAAVAGFGLPRWILGFMVGSRQKKFTAEFANAIDVIVRGVKSGLPLNECLKIIAREAPEPLGSEFQRICDSISMGVPMDQCLSKMFERMPLPEVSFFSIVLSIQLKAGGNLSEALNNLSVVLRARKMMREKVNALSSEAKASAAIIGALPICVCGLVYMTSPDYMGLLFSDPTGHMGLLAGTIMMSLGIFVMRQMINFDI